MLQRIRDLRQHNSNTGSIAGSIAGQNWQGQYHSRHDSVRHHALVIGRDEWLAGRQACQERSAGIVRAASHTQHCNSLPSR